MIVLSCFDGMSCGQIALERAGISMEKYYASEIDKYAIQVTMANYPNTIQLGSITEWQSWDIEQPDIIIGGSPCFVAGTKIITKEGVKNIEDILIGDFVLTHKNRFKKVLRIGGNKNKKTLITKIQGIMDIESTLEHPFYVREMNRKWDNEERTSYRVLSDPLWKEAKDLRKNDFLGLPIISTSENILNITEEEAFIIGRYIADGHTRKDFRTNENRPNDRHWQLILSIGVSKLDNFKEQVKETPYSCYPHSSSVHRCVFSSKRLVEIVEEHCGCGAENKFISMTLLNLPIKLLTIIIGGYLSGDGSFRKNTHRANTVSSNLIFSLSLAVAKVYGAGFGYEYTKTKPFHIIEGRLVNQKDIYTISFAKEIKKQSNYIVDNDVVWLPFKKSILCNESKNVFNIEVEEDNSYTANGVFVHNCQGFSFAGKQLNFEDERSKLFFTFVDILKHYKPKYFLLENVVMKKEYEDVISKLLYTIYPIDHEKTLFSNFKLKPYKINSALVSAQNRNRLYWTNITGIEQPKDKGILLKDIIENATADKDKSYCLDANYYKGASKEQSDLKGRWQLVHCGTMQPSPRDYKIKKIKPERKIELRNDFKSNALTTSSETNYIITGGALRGRNKENPSDRTPGIETEQRLEINETGKSNALTSVSKDSLVIFDNPPHNNKFKQTATIHYKTEKAKTLLADSGDKTRGIGIHDDSLFWRKLTPIECERLQTVNTIHEIEVELCLDQIKNYVNAVEKSHRLQKHVLSVEKNKLIEFAKLVVKNIQASNPQIKHTVLQNVDMLIQKTIEKCMKLNQEEKNIIVDFAEKKTMYNYQNTVEDFVIQNVFTNIIQVKIINTGKAELHLKDKNLCYQSSGKKLLKMSGKEIMQLVEIADMIFQKTEKQKCTYTILYHLNIKNIDRMLIILYWYAKIVIDLYTQTEMEKKNILLNYSFENSYTNHVSNSQRYKMLGNGWTVDVIAHIFSFIK
jgi:site-specific DNA-cytosine methylase